MAPTSALTVLLCSALLWAPARSFEIDFPWQKPADSAADGDEVPEIKPVDPNAPFPKLPPVKAMLNGSDHTVSSIVTEVSKIQARVHSLEQKDQDKLAHKKAEFESELKAQETATRMVIEENVRIAARIAALKKGNDGLRKTAMGLKEDNKQMRAELRSAGTKIGAGADFVKTSLKDTDDKKATELMVLSEKKGEEKPTPAPVTDDSAMLDGGSDDSLREAAEDEKEDDHADAELSEDVKPAPKPKRGLFGRAVKTAAAKTKDDDKDDDDKDDDKDDEDDDKDEDKAESFLSVRMRTRRARAEESMESEAESESESESEEGAQSEDEESASQLPWKHHSKPALPPMDGQTRSMLQSVNEELQDLALQDHEGLEKETQIFHAKAAQEQQAHVAAITQQQRLNTTEHSLLRLQSRLNTAVNHLQGTKSRLDQRLRGLGQYLQHLAHLLLAPAKEAGALVDQMPVDVAIPPPANSTPPKPAGLVMLQTKSHRK